MRYDTDVSTYYVENFGCRATQADGAALQRQFEERGFARAATAREAELVVLNTCTVTSAADHDARAAIKRIQRQNRDAKIVVTGCYAQRAPEEVAALPGVAYVVGNSHKHILADLVLPNATIAEQNRHDQRTPVREAQNFLPISALTENRGLRTEDWIFVSDIFAHTELLAAPVFDAPNQRTRPNLKVQDGCDNRCSFCVIPYVRGQNRSLPLAEVIAEVKTLVAAGYREVVISGINLGRWGRDLVWGGPALTESRRACPELAEGDSCPPKAGNQNPRFEDLIGAILAETQLEKLRISSVEPMDWTDGLISLAAHSPRIAKHAHVPMQSGSDAVLRRMHRKYRPWHYREKIEKIRTAMPAAAIGADVMVGFPGETDSEFDSTRRLIEDLPFTYLHVFTYSPRPGTPAALMPNQVPISVARERNRTLRDLAAEKKQAFMRTFIGQTVEAITLGSQEEGSCGVGAPAREASTTDAHSSDAPASESSGSESSGVTEALTDNYLKLRLNGRHEPNQWLRTQVQGVVDGSLAASVAPV
jgi:threonylcarbamoyladenosine tRNA methylthiotransferase MtaB